MTEENAKPSFADFLAAYEPPPEDYERHQETLEHIKRSREDFAVMTAPVVADLQAHGYQVEQIADLDNLGIGDAGAVPILLRHLRGTSHVSLIITLTKPLASKWARSEARRRIVELYPTLTEDVDPAGQVRFYLAQALERIADDSISKQMIDIARDRRYGAYRGLVVEGLARLKASRDQTVPALLELLSASDVQVFAAIALGRLRVAAARPDIERLTHDPDSWIRGRARQALAKLPKQ